jgi:ATP-dependent Lon protease
MQNHTIPIDMNFRHIRAISLFQNWFRLKSKAIRQLGHNLDAICRTLQSVSNNIANSYQRLIINKDQYNEHLRRCTALKDEYKTLRAHGPITMGLLRRQADLPYRVAYLNYRCLELVKQCGASCLNDVLHAILQKDWELNINSRYVMALVVYNQIFVPFAVRIVSAAEGDNDIRISKYSAFTFSLLLKERGAEITLPYYFKQIIVKGYFREDPARIIIEHPLMQDKLTVIERCRTEARRRYPDSETFVNGYFSQLNIRDILCNDEAGILQSFEKDRKEYLALLEKPVDFAKLKPRATLHVMSLLLLDSKSWHLAAPLAGKLSDEIYGLMPVNIQRNYDELKKVETTSGQKAAKEEATESYETRIDNLACSDSIRRKCREKLREIRSSREGNDKPTKFLDGILQVPFGVYKQEPVLRFLTDFRKSFMELVSAMRDFQINIPSTEENVLFFYKNPAFSRSPCSPVVSGASANGASGELDSIMQRISPYLTESITENGFDQMFRALCGKSRCVSESIVNSRAPPSTPVPSSPISPAESVASTTSDADALELITRLQDMHYSWIQFKLDRRQYLQDVDLALNSSIYGQEEAKRRIKSLAAQWINGEMSGVVFGFQGYPGTGKTTFAKQGLAKCLLDAKGEPRPFYFISLGGANGGHVLEGHSYTYVGSHWGKLVECLQECKVMNPIIYFDELDKVSDTPRGEEIIRILTHLTDPEQNTNIEDRYFNIGFDFSKALLIFSYNDPSKIDSILMDRIVEIRFNQYNRQEKIRIANDYVIPRILKTAGYNTHDIVITDNLLGYIIESYTHEAGVRDLKDKLTELVRELNLRRIQNDTDTSYALPFPFTQEFIDDVLKAKNKLTVTCVPARSQIGWVNGLYATSMGTGGITVIQAYQTPSDNKYTLELTGKLGDVMKESVRCARTISWRIFKGELRSCMEQEWRDNALHVHFPAGGTSKDGPSAGAAITTAIISYFAKMPFRNYVAMTGEIDLHGNVTIIGGLQCKIEGARRAGVRLVLIPRENVPEYLEFCEKIGPEPVVIAVDNISQIVRTCLIGAEDDNFQYLHPVANDSVVGAISTAISRIETPEEPDLEV